MAKLGITPELEQIGNSIQSTSIADLEAAGIDLEKLSEDQAQLMDDSLLAATNAVATVLGVQPDNPLNIWQSEEGLVAGLPYFNSDGTYTMLHWGQQSIKVSGAISAVGQVSGQTIAVMVPGTFGEFKGAIMRIRCALREGVKEDALLECDSFEELAACLKVSIPYLPRKAVFESDVAELTIVKGEVKTSKNGDPYWEVIVNSTLGTHRFSLPSDAEFNFGDKVEVIRGDSPHLMLNGLQIQSGGGWVKMHELEMGKPYTIIEAKAKGGDYGGYDLVCPELGTFISANSQVEKFLEGLNNLNEISKDKPLVLTVDYVRELKNGNKQATLSLKHGNQSPLAALLARKGKAQSSTPAPTTTPVASGKVGGTGKDEIDF